MKCIVSFDVYTIYITFEFKGQIKEDFIFPNMD